MLSVGISPTAAGIVVGAYGLTQLLLRIPLGVSADILKNHKFFIILGVLIAGGSSMFHFFAHQSVVLHFFGEFTSGIASSMWVSFTILFCTYFSASEGTKAIGRINAYQNLGILLGFIVGGLAATSFGIRPLFFFSFVAGMIGLVLSSFIKREPVTHRNNVSVANLLSVMKNKRLLFFAGVCSFTYFIVFATFLSFSTSTAKQLGATSIQLGAFSALYSVACIIGSFFIGSKAASRLGEKRLLPIGFVLMAIYCFSIPFYTNAYPFFPMQFIGGIGSGILTSSLMAFAIRYVDPQKKSTAMGFYQSLYCVGMTIGPIIMGVLVDHTTIRFSFFFMAVIAIICAIIIPLVYKYSSILQPPSAETN